MLLFVCCFCSFVVVVLDVVCLLLLFVCCCCCSLFDCCYCACCCICRKCSPFHRSFHYQTVHTRICKCCSLPPITHTNTHTQTHTHKHTHTNTHKHTHIEGVGAPNLSPSSSSVLLSLFPLLRDSCHQKMYPLMEYVRARRFLRENLEWRETERQKEREEEDDERDGGRR